MRPSAADVGRRVVVRHRLADGRATDVVGVLRSWDGSGVRVLPADGAVVVVDLAAVVAARVVGPARAGAPAARDGLPAAGRSAAVAAVAAAGAPAPSTPVDVAAARTAPGWGAAREDALGDWLLRGGSGRMLRASSALALGDPGIPLGAALARTAEHYRALGLVPAVQVAAATPGGSGVESAGGARGRDELEGALARAGWRPQPWTVLALRAASSLVPPPAGRAAPVVLPSAGPAWLAATDHHGSPLPRADLPPERDGVAVAHAGVPAADVAGTCGCGAAGPPAVQGAPLGPGGAAPLVAVARGALAQRWLGITCVSVDPAHRRRGLARAMTDALLDHLGGPAAADALYVQVVSTNAVARAAWRALGFADHSRYRFWTLPGDA